MIAIRHHRRIPTAGLLLLALLALVAGCDFFEPTEPEPPRGDALVGRYTAPETTLTTIQLAILDKSTTNGSDIYIAAFADTLTDGIGYTAFFDPVTVARFPGQSTEWDRERERIFYASLSRQQPGSTFLFSWGVFPGAPDDEISATTALLHRSYVLDATTDNENFVHIARGRADLYFQLVGGNWKIVRWQDYEDPDADFDAGEQSFGHLRLERQ